MIAAPAVRRGHGEPRAKKRNRTVSILQITREKAIVNKNETVSFYLQAVVIWVD
jgi:hypothetical protein